MMDRFPPLLTNATLGGTWFTQMGEAAVAHNVSVQLCMAYSRHVLASLASPSITQVRGMSHSPACHALLLISSRARTRLTFDLGAGCSPRPRTHAGARLGRLPRGE